MAKAQSFDKKFGRETPWGGKKKIDLPIKKAAFYVAVALCAMAVVAVALLICGAIKISSIDVSGNDMYVDSEVLAAAELSEGKGYFDFDPGKVEQTLQKELPYIKEVEVKRHFGGKVSVTLKEETGFYYTRHNVNYYIISSDTWRVIEASYSASDFKELGAVYVGLPTDARVRIGEKVTFAYANYAEGDDTEIKKHPDQDANKYYEYVFKFIETVNKSSMADRVTGMELSNERDLFIIIDGNVKANLGDMSELERKLESAYARYNDNYEKVISEGFLGAVIEAADPQKATFREASDLILPG